jgi:hypothetical protein
LYTGAHRNDEMEPITVTSRSDQSTADRIEA